MNPPHTIYGEAIATYALNPTPHNKQAMLEAGKALTCATGPMQQRDAAIHDLAESLRLGLCNQAIKELAELIVRQTNLVDLELKARADRVVGK